MIYAPPTSRTGGTRVQIKVMERFNGAAATGGSVPSCGVCRSRGHWISGGFQGSEPGVAPALLGAARDLLPRPRRSRRRDDGTGVPRHDQPYCCSRRTRADGDGDHPVHGQGVRCAPESRGQHRILASWRFPMASAARLHRRAADRRDARCPVPARRGRRLGDVRVELPGSRATRPAMRS